MRCTAYLFHCALNPSNTSDIQPDMLSSDNHGTNKVNFAILDLFGYQFAPRYARFKHAFSDLFLIDVNAKSGEPFIKLRVPINETLIIEEWDSIQRIICSLSRKTLTQHTLVKILSNMSKQHKTVAALREYDRLVKANYLLNYLDDEELRRYVQQVLNRGEAYHQLRRKISSVNGDKFRGGNDAQIALWNDCARLIANSIIYYNSVILSNLLNKAEQQGNSGAKAIIAGLSPVAWQRVNLNGNYAFIDNEPINMEALLDEVSVDARHFERKNGLHL